MTGGVMALVLLGALLHAGWNVLVKSSADKTLDTAVIHVFCALIALPAALLLGPPPAAAMPYLFASVAIHVGYYFALANAYRHGSLGLTYPIMRGTAPLLVALASWGILNEGLSLIGWIGVITLCLGVIWLGISADIRQQKAAFGYALANAAIVALYTLVDAQGVRLSSENALSYIALLFSLDGWIFGVTVFAQRRSILRGYIATRWPLALGGAVASVGSYAIALWAMTVAPVAAVAALRETSVLFAVLLGSLILRETITGQRALATLLIVLGAISIRLGAGPMH
ncbi:MAG: hypothetical protein RLZZ344_358 [Pseudomonadota bacterium]|jgi:phosphonate utilization associated putative membrane protein